MWCVPTAVAALAEWNRERVWLDILAERHARGRRLTNIPGPINEPHGGLHSAEALRVLDRAGFATVSAWDGTRRLDPVEFLDSVKGAGHWLVMQRMHLAHINSDGDDHSLVLHPEFPVVKAWRVFLKGSG